MQKTIIIGNVGSPAIARQSENRMFLAFTIAVNDRYTDRNGQQQENTTWYNCTYPVKTDALAQYITKGSQLYIEGLLKPKLYTNRDGGQSIDLALYVNELKLLS